MFPSDRGYAAGEPPGSGLRLPHRLLLATRNRHKLREIRGLLSDLSFEIVSLSDIELPHSPREESVEVFETFEENAVAKARYYRTLTGLPTIADDSGLCVDALSGGPGVRSRRFAEVPAPDSDQQDRANNEHLLRLLEDVPEAERGAHYRCALALIDDSITLLLSGRVYGRIAVTERGSEGFGYDPLFIVPAHDRTFGELPPEVKAVTSHRAAAIRSLRQWLA